MERTSPQAIKRLLNEGQPDLETGSRLSRSYGLKVSEQLTKMFAGNPASPEAEEFRLMIASWTETLQDVVPEYRLNDAFLHARRNRNSNFVMDVSEVCNAWNLIKQAEKSAIGRYELSSAREVCPFCNNTGYRVAVRRDPVLGLDYACSIPCAVI